MSDLIRIGTRTSALALWQAHDVAQRLQDVHDGLQVEFVEIVSAGDKTLDVPLSQVGGKGLFLKELEEALLNNEVDIAVHSMKDVTVDLPDGLEIPVVCEREDPKDAFVSEKYDTLESLPEGAVVGTCSLRRRSQLLAHFPYLKVENLRGNVNTRLKRLQEGQYDAIILAVAGLKRLQFAAHIRQELSTELFLPAVGQGVVGVECRADDERVKKWLKPINHYPTAICVSAERAANKALEGGCHVPIAVYAQWQGDGEIVVTGRVGALDGSELLEAVVSGSPQDAEQLGQQVAEKLIKQGADSILKDVYSQ